MDITSMRDAKVMAKGQITIPKDIRDYLGISNGSRVLFVIEDGKVLLVNPAVYAVKMMQKGMAGEAERTGLTDEESVNSLVKEIRNERSDG
jgi:antitoxin PrlF